MGFFSGFFSNIKGVINTFFDFFRKDGTVPPTDAIGTRGGISKAGLQRLGRWPKEEKKKTEPIGR